MLRRRSWLIGDSPPMMAILVGYVRVVIFRPFLFYEKVETQIEHNTMHGRDQSIYLHRSDGLMKLSSKEMLSITPTSHYSTGDFNTQRRRLLTIL